MNMKYRQDLLGTILAVHFNEISCTLQNILQPIRIKYLTLMINEKNIFVVFINITYIIYCYNIHVFINPC